MDFSERLSALMEEQNTNPHRLASSINTSNSVTRGWRDGSKRPTLDNLVAVADYFSVSLDYLVGRSDVREVASAQPTPPEIKKGPSPDISRNGSDMLALFEQLPEREQSILIGEARGLLLALSLQAGDTVNPPASQAG